MQTELVKAKSIYSKGGNETKKALEEIFGKQNFQTKITDRVKTLDDAAEVINIEPVEIRIPTCFSISESLKPFKKQQQAHLSLMVIASALNEGWEPDWNDSNQYKYYPYFDMRPKTGFGFSITYYDFVRTFTSVGSRLCYRTRELAEYAGKQFESYYKDLLAF